MVSFRNENENSAKNFNSVSIGDVTFYFSYETCVGVNIGHRLYVHKNIWGTTTGKHLNWLDGGNKEDRLDSDEFDKIISRVSINVKVSE